MNKIINNKISGGKSSITEIKKYNDTISKSLRNKELRIIDSKTIIEPVSELNGDSYYKVVDMLSPVKEKEGLQTIIQKYLRSFTTLDTALAQNQNTFYEFKSKTLNKKILNQDVYKILEYSFFEMSSVISRPSYYITSKKVVINLFIFDLTKQRNLLSKSLHKLEGLTSKLSRYFKKPVSLELTRLYSVSNNSQILVNILGRLGRLRKNSFPRIIRKFLKFQSNKIFFRKNQNRTSKFYTLLSGVNIKLGGRLMRGKIVPRRTVKKIQYGSLSRSKSNYVTFARYTQKNKRGTFSFTVSIGHKFI